MKDNIETWVEKKITEAKQSTPYYASQKRDPTIIQGLNICRKTNPVMFTLMQPYFEGKVVRFTKSNEAWDIRVNRAA